MRRRMLVGVEREYIGLADGVVTVSEGIAGKLAEDHALAALPLPVHLLAHPRLRAKAAEHGIALERGALRPAAPLPYAQMVAAVHAAQGVVTDSGGLQKEAYLLERPCTTVRTETEWPETLVDGWNLLVRPDAVATDLEAAVLRLAPTTSPGAPFGDGRAAERVVSELESA